MAVFLWRVLIAVLCVVLVLALLPPVFRLIGLDVSGDLWLVIRICVAGLAALYVLGAFPLKPPQERP